MTMPPKMPPTICARMERQIFRACGRDSNSTREGRQTNLKDGVEGFQRARLLGQEVAILARDNVEADQGNDAVGRPRKEDHRGDVLIRAPVLSHQVNGNGHRHRLGHVTEPKAHQQAPLKGHAKQRHGKAGAHKGLDQARNNGHKRSGFPRNLDLIHRTRATWK